MGEAEDPTLEDYSPGFGQSPILLPRVKLGAEDRASWCPEGARHDRLADGLTPIANPKLHGKAGGLSDAMAYGLFDIAAAKRRRV